MQRIEKAVSYKEKVYKELKAGIISQRIKPGEILNERKLAQTLGISRTPVREAIQMLANEKWIIIEPYRGAYVYELTEKDIVEVFQVRLALECLAIELIVDKISKEDIVKLKSIFKKQEKLKEKYEAEAFIEADREFHTFIAKHSDNRVLIDMLNELGDVLRRLGVQAVQDKKRFIETLDEHTAILDALSMNNKDGAIDAMKHHITKTMDNIYNRYIKIKKKSVNENI